MKKGAKKDAGAKRIVAVNMPSEKKRLNARIVQDQAAAPLPEAGSCVSWACAAVRG
jgi:hypothetical protein